MSSAIAFAAGKAFPDELVDPGVGELLDAVAAPDRELPCRAGDADLWFAEAPADLERAKQLCTDCPVRAACLAGALARREPWGVWGGEIFERGAVVARKRPRGRPRKNPVAGQDTADAQRSAAA
ncbi:WhiB family transcriptional regulator [Amycolatopsis cihanbeyliensis]|uniref:Transcriptional regulator WhiB n=1 Tax=Amycolatopsis cihanbeyliensis TaxID=1128664 RepID=A0A542DPF2_AMYCI|nr:WhiB family transcriptional regulator [Amycolatopsis cihanbeyliensis]TQJ04991.1 WhiB family redox-sensing transcriptional regulator [Amycolatopsis cihanbeyliensis]